MIALEKKTLSERDICTKFITPAVKKAGWDEMSQIREEVSFSKGRIIVRGKLVTRGKAKRADYILYYQPNIPLALIEAKDNSRSVGDGIQQGLEYAVTLNIPFVFSFNGGSPRDLGRNGKQPGNDCEFRLGLPDEEFPFGSRGRSTCAKYPKAQKSLRKKNLTANQHNIIVVL